MWHFFQKPCSWFLPWEHPPGQKSGWGVTRHPARSSRKIPFRKKTPLMQSALFKRNLSTRLSGNPYFNNPLAHNLSWLCQRKAAGFPFLRALKRLRVMAQGSPLAERKEVLESPLLWSRHFYLST